MYIRVSKSGSRKYVYLLEAYRDEKGKPKQRFLASLGRLEDLGVLKSVHSGLSRILGVDSTEADNADLSLILLAPLVMFGCFLSFGSSWGSIACEGFCELKPGTKLILKLCCASW